MIGSGQPILTAAAMRATENAAIAAGVSQHDLMERAGAAVARETARFAEARPIVVLAGPGNNGGDAYVCARLLRDAGRDVVVAAHGRPSGGAALAMASRWSGETVTLAKAPERAVVVDGLFGTGLSRPLAPDVSESLNRLVGAAEMTISIDLPSGIATDTGDDLGAASGTTLTLALGALKPGHVIGSGAARSGTVRVVDISVDCTSAWRTIARPALHAPSSDAHKYRGFVLVLGGAMPGAAALAARAAAGAGAGYVVLAAADRHTALPDAIVQRSPADIAELLSDDRIGAVVIGPGLGRDARARTLLDAALDSARALVVDGDALTLLGRDAADRVVARAAPTILTPHSGEFDRMFGTTGDGKIACTLAAARACGATVVHKGHDTVIAHPDGAVTVSTGATSWLATAGTGDVLAGVVAARLALGGRIAEAVWLHARAATLAGPAFVADTLVAHLPRALGECL